MPGFLYLIDRLLDRLECRTTTLFPRIRQPNLLHRLISSFLLLFFIKNLLTFKRVKSFSFSTFAYICVTKCVTLIVTFLSPTKFLDSAPCINSCLFIAIHAPTKQRASLVTRCDTLRYKGRYYGVRFVEFPAYRQCDLFVCPGNPAGSEDTLLLGLEHQAQALDPNTHLCISAAAQIRVPNKITPVEERGR